MSGTRIEVHAAPLGAPLGDGTPDYPVRTVEAALALVRARRAPGQHAVVWLHAGTFRLDGPVVLGPQDSRTTIAAWPGDEVVLDGGHVLDAWEEDELDGRPVWTAAAPASAGRSLFVDGERRERPSHPREGELRMARVPGLDLEADLLATLFDGSDTFVAAPGDLPALADPEGVEVVVPHYWISERLPVASVDPATGTVTSPYRSILALRDGDAAVPARYRLEGVVDLLGTVPGEWYLDRRGVVPTAAHPEGSGAARVLYAPRPGEDRATFRAVVPATGRLLVVEGTPEEPVRDVRVEGVVLRHADWPQAPVARVPFQMREDPVLPDVPYASDPQAAASVPGAVELRHAHDCALVDCTVEHVGGFAVRLEAGAQGCLVSGCTLRDTAAGSLAVGGDDTPDGPGAACDNEISDCELVAGGRVYPHAVALLLRHASRTRVLHNAIHDHYSTGIALGWRWDYSPSPAVDNLVEGNHLHHLGQGRLDWFGAVYTLGVSPGTVVRRNLVHDVVAARFGGWGLLVDPSTSHVVVEENVVHSVSSECLHVKTGRENTVRRNVLALGGTGQVSLAVLEPHTAATLSQNVLVGRGTPAFAGAPGSLPTAELAASPHGLRADLDLVWDVVDGADAVLAGDGDVVPGPDGTPRWSTAARHDDAWRASGRERHAVVADPGLVVADDGTVTLTRPEVVEALGAWVPDLVVGPRPDADRPHPGRRPTLPYRTHEASRRPVRTGRVAAASRTTVTPAGDTAVADRSRTVEEDR